MWHRPHQPLLLSVALGCWLSTPAAADPRPDAAAVEFFEKKVRPVLVEQCASCHGGKKMRGGLSVESRAALLQGGDSGAALLPAQPEKSLLIQAIGYKEQLRMPPRSKLKDEQIRDLTAWVAMGAPWPGAAQKTSSGEKIDRPGGLSHWAFQPVRALPPPTVRQRDWPRGPIDAFVLARLERAGLKPAPPVDRRTLLRRLTFDLTGLPPTPRELADFLADASPAARERAVDRLLASPAYGERWGRHWLDLVRFAETSGHEFDFEIPQAHGYRDYVIRALNADVPYDQFVREHLAGDLLPQPRRHPVDGSNESVPGTGFWFLGESKHSPVDVRVDGADRRDNMIDVFGKAFLGLTIACARCHDHKFDPVTTREYYSLVSYLQSSRMQLAFLDPPERIAVPSRRLRELRTEAARLAIERSAAALDGPLAGLSAALLEARRGGKTPLAALLEKTGERPLDDPLHVWRQLGTAATPAAFETKRRDLSARFATLAEQATGMKRFADFHRDDFRDWFVSGDAFGDRPADASDVEVQPDRPLPARRLLRGAHGGLASGRLQGALRSRTFTIESDFILYRFRGDQVTFNLIIDGFQQIRAPIYGGLRFEARSAVPVWHALDVRLWRGLQAYVEVLDDGDGHVELEQVVFSDRPSPPPQAPNRLVVQLVEKARSPEELAAATGRLLRETLTLWRQGRLSGRDDAADRRALIDGLLAHDGWPLPPTTDADGRLAKLLAEAARQEQALPAPRRGLALADGSGVQERVHIRGNPRTLGEEAPRRLPAAVVGGRQPEPTTRSGRLPMAERLTAADNPLLPRVIVNRLWHHHFGAGIVATTDDLGHQGDPPTHPELLDWLAGELVRSGWSLKHLHRLMVLSNTYRQASRADAAAEQADPRNLLLHRMPIRRLEAEAIRDAMLAVSGRLDRTMFGRGPLPHLTEFMAGRGRPASGPLDGDGRRSLYLNVRRNFLPPLFLAFDYPVPFTAIGRRSVSNVPAQALTLLNNPFVTGQARLWAERSLAEPGDDATRVAALFETAFGRPPSADEHRAALAFLAAQAREHGRLDARARADLAHVLFNVKEFVFVH